MQTTEAVSFPTLSFAGTVSGYDYTVYTVVTFFLRSSSLATEVPIQNRRGVKYFLHTTRVTHTANRLWS